MFLNLTYTDFIEMFNRKTLDGCCVLNGVSIKAMQASQVSSIVLSLLGNLRSTGGNICLKLEYIHQPVFFSVGDFIVAPIFMDLFKLFASSQFNLLRVYIFRNLVLSSRLSSLFSFLI